MTLDQELLQGLLRSQPTHSKKIRTLWNISPYRTNALRSNSKKEAQQNNPAAVHLCTFKQSTCRKKHAPYRTHSKPRTSAERGQEKIQRHYRAPSRTTL